MIVRVPQPSVPATFWPHGDGVVASARPHAGAGACVPAGAALLLVAGVAPATVAPAVLGACCRARRRVVLVVPAAARRDEERRQPDSRDQNNTAGHGSREVLHGVRPPFGGCVILTTWSTHKGTCHRGPFRERYIVPLDAKEGRRNLLDSCGRARTSRARSHHRHGLMANTFAGSTSSRMRSPCRWR